MTKCWFCGSDMRWDSDFSFEDMGIESKEDGIVSHLTCTGCGATAEFTSKIEEV